jgi:hypothetical protein
VIGTTAVPAHTGEHQMPMPQNIPPRLTVVPLDVPVVGRHGFGPDSVYVEFVYPCPSWAPPPSGSTAASECWS